ncbi:hypothetical protein I3843_13G033600 [Carya illinoinensis]|nr:hypothetical protein I3843_13G033600 [Carya illinoinensis]
MAHSNTAGPSRLSQTFKNLSLSFSLPHSLVHQPFSSSAKGGSTSTPVFSTTMQPCVDDVSDDIDNLSINSTTTSATTTTTTTTTTTISTPNETKCSTSSSTETTTRTGSSHASSSAKPHAPSHDPCWTAIRRVKSENPATLGLEDLRFLHRLGSGDIGSVFLVELKGSNGCMFAAKVMDKKELVNRNKDDRARIEREILEILDHPFLPRLYATLDSPRWSCLLTEFCPGGDLHVIRQNQPEKRFDEAAVRCVQLLIT